MKLTKLISTANKPWLIVAVLYTLTVVAVSLYPLPEMHWQRGSDKTVHFFMYFFLYAVWRAAGYRSLRLLIVLAGFGILIEILQGILPVHRTADFWDATANVAGILTAYYIWPGSPEDNPEGAP